MSALAAPAVISHLRPFRRLIVPRPFALIGLGAFLLIVANYLSFTVEAAHSLTLAAPITFFASAAGLGALIVAAWAPGEALGQAREETRWELAGRAVMTVIMAAMAVASFLLVIAGLYYAAIVPPSGAYLNDVISFNAANAHTLLAGHNPYTDDANFIPTLIAYPKAPPTPIQGPIFGYGFNYPLQGHVFAIDRAYIRDPVRYAAAFDPRTLHSYPALSFLIYVPLFLVGVQNVMWVNLIAYVALLLWLISLAPRGQRVWVAFTGLAAVTITFGSLLLETELICLLFLLPAWRLRDERGWVSALLLGLSCAFKQYCWLFAPLFLLDALLRHGWRAAARRALIALAAFLAPNLPFIIASPGAWWQSIWLPLTAALFPQGVGLVTLALGRVLPPLPKLAFTALEIAAMGAVLWAYARYHGRLREAALILALVPFFVAFRSPPNYFAAAPWLALFTWLWLQRARTARLEKVVRASALPV
ncbi:MAG TPA: hypothetical protein VFQ25_06590 [Ktedonobacterales bacterium]|nr:hypothetical protein [Ktedonobacterales bacterium]